MPGITTRPSLRHRCWIVIALGPLVAFQCAPVCAWGRLGHRVICRIAEKNLNPKAKAAIAELLNPGETLADASTWADEHRRALPKTAPWHYVDVPLDEPQYDAMWSADDPKKGFIVDKIAEFRKTLKDPGRPIEDRRFALRFLIHCIEDLDMPMHVGDNKDRGGKDTQIRFFDRGTNMHSLRDGGMIERVSKSEDHWLKDLTVLTSPQSRDTTTDGTLEDWATESLLAARKAYQDPSTGMRIKPGAKLAGQYFDKNLPVIRERLYRARMRLAMVLNEAFSENGPGEPEN